MKDRYKPSSLFMSWTEGLKIRKNALFRKPEGGMEAWISIGVGTIIVVLSLNGQFGGSRSTLFYLFIGLFLGLSAAAEILPKTWTQTAGLLRVLSSTFMILLCVYILSAILTTKVS